MLDRLPLRASRLGIAALICLTSACAPKIGDSCDNSTDCSVNGDRVCDTAQPGGYCTVRGCDPDSCQEGAICVEWRFSPSRTATTYCMKRCGSCRSGYDCVSDDDPRLADESGTPIARITDLSSRRRDARFCAAVEGFTPITPSDLGAADMSTAPDFGTDQGADAGSDMGSGAGSDMGSDAGSDAGADAGP